MARAYDQNQDEYRCIPMQTRIITIKTKLGTKQFVAPVPNVAFIARLRKLREPIIEGIWLTDMEFITEKSFWSEQEAHDYLAGHRYNEQGEPVAVERPAGRPGPMPKAVKEIRSGLEFKSKSEACEHFGIQIGSLNHALKCKGGWYAKHHFILI